MAARFLAYLLQETDSVDHAIAAYAQGLGSVQRNGVSEAVDSYVSAVLATAQRF